MNGTATNYSISDITKETESTTDGSNNTENNGILVAVYNATIPTETGWIKKMIALRVKIKFTVEIKCRLNILGKQLKF